MWQACLLGCSVLYHKLQLAAAFVIGAGVLQGRQQGVTAALPLGPVDRDAKQLQARVLCNTCDGCHNSYAGAATKAVQLQYCQSRDD